MEITNPEINLISQQDGLVIPITEDMVVGRTVECDLVIEEDQLSRRHAKLFFKDGGLWLEDLKSTNGSFINELRIEQATQLAHADMIRFDIFAFQVQFVSNTSVAGNFLEEEKTALRTHQAEVVEAKTNLVKAPESWALANERDSGATQLLSIKSTANPINAAITTHLNEADFESDAPTLLGLSGNLQGRIFQFSLREKTSKWEIGRDESCDIQIDEPSISANHAQLINEENRWKIVDLISANGTYVNGQKTLGSYLTAGDTVKFGEIEFLFKLPKVEDVEETVTPQSKIGLYIGGVVFAVTLIVFVLILSLSSS